MKNGCLMNLLSKVWENFSPSVHAQCCTIDDLSKFFSEHTLLFRTNESCIIEELKFVLQKSGVRIPLDEFFEELRGGSRREHF